MKKTTQTFVLEGANVKAMYSESGGIDVRSLGRIKQARKVSDVRFNRRTQEWEAIDRRTKLVVVSHPSRKECVRLEHQHYDRGISKGKFPWNSRSRRRGSTK